MKKATGKSLDGKQTLGTPRTSNQVVAGALLELSRDAIRRGMGSCVWRIPVVLSSKDGKSEDNHATVVLAFGPAGDALHARALEEISPAPSVWQRLKARVVRAPTQDNKAAPPLELVG